MESTAQLLPNEQEIEEARNLIVNPLKGIQITCREEYVRAVDFKKRIKSGIREIKEKYEDAKSQAKRTHQKICDLEKKDLKPLEDADLVLDGLIEKFLLAQREIERRAQEEARRIAEEEKIAQAIALDGLGEEVAACELLDAPISNVIPIVQPIQAQTSIPKIKGFSVQERYRVEVVDVRALFRAVAEGKASMACFLINQGFLDRQAQALKDEFNFPGCRVTKHIQSGTRAAQG